MSRLQWAYAVVWFLLFLQPRAQDLTTIFLSLPSCAQSCGLQYESQISSSGCSTIQCFCSDTSLLSVIESCVASGCSASDQQKTFSILGPYCPSLANPFSSSTGPSVATTPLSATVSTTATAPTTPTVLTTPTVFTTPTSPVASTTVISAPTVITTPTTAVTSVAPTTLTTFAPTSSTTHSNTTTAATAVFTGAATLPVANLALIGMGLIGAFHGLL